MEFNITRFLGPAKITWTEAEGYKLTNGDTRTFKTYNEAYDAARN
jgi:hypothetical protein